MPDSSYQLRIAAAVQEAFSDVKPTDSPSGGHKVFMLGQLVLNIQSEEPTRERCRAVPGRRCCGRCHN